MSLKCFTNLIFFTAIRGHHVYKRTWNPFIGEKLTCRKDNREEAQEIDIHAVGIYKKDVSSEQATLVGHIPIELSRLMSGFLGASEQNCIGVTVDGKRKRELGLIVPGRYKAKSSGENM